MARDPAATRLIPLPVIHPWVFILGGLGIALLSWLTMIVLPSAGPLRVGLALAGASAALVGVGMRLHERRWLLHDRIETAAMIAAAGMSFLGGYFSMDKNWDAGKMLFGALFIASLAAVMLVILPPIGRKIFLTLFIFFHFGGMVTAVTSIDPPNSTGPWVSKQLWTYVYRPYLSFLYTTNAYHFYSPDPGPASIFWFSVTYEDGSRSWVKVPNRETSAIGMQYQRNLALPEHTYSPLGRLPYTRDQIREIQLKQPNFTAPRGSWEDIYERRVLASNEWLFPVTSEENDKTVEKALPIPMVLEWDVNLYLQYREPTDVSKDLIASVARRIYLTAPKKFDANGNEVPVKSVKVYRVTHQILTPQELSKDVSPWEPTKYWPYFLGEFDGEGKLLNDREPFLYWYLPIVNRPKNRPFERHLRQPYPFVRIGVPRGDDTFVLDTLEMHAAGKLRLRQKGD